MENTSVFAGVFLCFENQSEKNLQILEYGL